MDHQTLASEDHSRFAREVLQQQHRPWRDKQPEAKRLLCDALCDTDSVRIFLDQVRLLAMLCRGIRGILCKVGWRRCNEVRITEQLGVCGDGLSESSRCAPRMCGTAPVFTISKYEVEPLLTIGRCCYCIAGRCTRGCTE